MFTFGEKIAWPGSQPNTSALQIMGKTVREILRNDDALNTPFAKQRGDDLRKARLLDAALSKLVLIAGKRQHMAMRRLLAGAIYFQIAHDDVASTALPQKNERIRHEHAGGI